MKRKLKGIVSLILMLAMSFMMLMPAYAADIAEAEKQAEALRQIHLFKGVSDSDFALDRAPTRVEAIVMLIRALGEEPDAMEGKWKHPFTDVDSWSALEAKLTKEDVHGATTLAQRLMTAGLLKPEEYRAAKQTAIGTENLPSEAGKAAVSTVADFEKAFADNEITEINIVSDMDITGEITLVH